MEEVCRQEGPTLRSYHVPLAPRSTRRTARIAVEQTEEKVGVNFPSFQLQQAHEDVEDVNTLQNHPEEMVEQFSDVRLQKHKNLLAGPDK